MSASTTDDRRTDEQILTALGRLTGDIEKTREKLEGRYAEQTGLFRILRERGVTNRRIAETARISEEAVIQRLRPKKAAGAKVAKAAKPARKR